MNSLNISTLRTFVVTLFTILFCFASATIAQSTAGKQDTGKITGTVVDAKTGEPIIGANVAITGTTQGAATDLDGKYTISGIAPGIYSITASYISYSKKNITGVEVDTGETTHLNISMMPQTIGMDEVTVTAEASTNNEAGLLSLQRKAIPLQDGLSSEFLGKTGDGDVAAAIKRVTGVTLLNDNNVYVRGLGNRYSNIQLNGSEVPSTNPTQKEAPVDLVGSGLVDNIVVQKTFTADQSGEFSGGSVQITTREFPDSRNLGFSYSTSVKSVSGFKNTLSSAGSATDFLGFDDGKRSLPSVFNSQRLGGDSNELEMAFSQDLHGDWVVGNSQNAIPSQKFSINYADLFNDSKLPIGIVSNFTYKYDRNYQPDAELFKIQSSAGDGEVIPNSDYSIDKGSENVKLSGMLNVFLKPSDVTKIGFKNLYSNSLENSASVITGDFINYDQFTVRQTVLNFDQRSIFSSTVDFETYLKNFFDSRLSANVSYNKANRNQPDRRATHYNKRKNDDEAQYGVYFSDGGNNHYFAEQEDHNYAGEFNYELNPFSFVKVKMGGNYTDKKRDFYSRRFEYEAFRFNSSVYNAYPEESRTSSPNEALSSELVESNALQIQETSQPRDSYEGEQTLWAGYLSTTWTPINRTTIELGARLENSVQEVFITPTLDDNEDRERISNVESQDILPAVNFTYSLTDKTNLRAAFSKTLARPDFREISNFRFQDFLGGEILYGNPDLQRTTIQNYDLRYEIYPSPGELFAVSAYYKHFDNPIEKMYRVTERLEVIYENAEEGELFGIEVEGRKNVLPKLQLVANASFIFSETRVKEENRANVANLNRPMYGQSPYTINFGAFYSIPEWNLNLSANYNTFGERIVTVGQKRQPGDEFEQPFHNVNFKADYRRGDLSFSVGVGNLLNQERVFKQGSITTYKYAPGLTFDAGIKLSF